MRVGGHQHGLLLLSFRTSGMPGQTERYGQMIKQPIASETSDVLL
jgi:hypothetical protein